MKGAIGLTGGIACGKSEVAGFLAQLQVPVLDTDIVARDLLEPEHWVFEKVVQEFGKQILNDEGGIDRKKLGAQIFGDATERDKLNRIMHPVVYQEVDRWVEHALTRHENPVVMIPLLYETNAQGRFKKVIVVAADAPVMEKRLRLRGLSLEDSRMRIQAQMPVEEKVERADHVIWNNGSLDELKEKTVKLWTENVLERKSKS